MSTYQLLGSSSRSNARSASSSFENIGRVDEDIKLRRAAKCLATAACTMQRGVLSCTSPLYLKHGKAQGAHAMVQAGKCKGPNQQSLLQALEALNDTHNKLPPCSRLRPAQARMAEYYQIIWQEFNPPSSCEGP